LGVFFKNKNWWYDEKKKPRKVSCNVSYFFSFYHRGMVSDCLETWLWISLDYELCPYRFAYGFMAFLA
jgi:hypothetical protein